MLQLLAALALCATPSVQEDAPQRPNVLVWIAAGLRADRVRPEVAPTIAAFTEGALVAERCWATAPEPPAALASLLTGTFPRVHGMWSAAREEGESDPPRLAEELPTLAAAFRAGGYFTVFVADGGYVLENRGFDLGFEYFDSSYTLAESRAERALEFLETRPTDRPYLFVLHVNQARLPWFAAPEVVERFADPAYDGPLLRAWRRAWGKNGLRVPPGMRIQMAALMRQHYEPVLAGALEPADLRFAAALYDACVWTEDRQLARVLAYLDELGERERTLVVIVGDHGTSLGELAPVGAAALDEGALAVPLLVAGPGLAPGTIAGLAQTTDLAPTLLALCGLERPKGMQGRDLVGEGTGETAIVETRAEGPRALVWTAGELSQLDESMLRSTPTADLQASPPEVLRAWRAAHAFIERCAATRAALGL